MVATRQYTAHRITGGSHRGLIAGGEDKTCVNQGCYTAEGEGKTERLLYLDWFTEA